MPSKIASKLLKWYASRQRALPWREQPEPYAVWVAEIMAQQTRLESMLPYYERWLQRFPDIESLAAAEEEDVLASWEGLGYYSRARNLHRAARFLVSKYEGKLPKDVRALRALPGIGSYTAGAIASLAFGLDEAAVDGNAARVLSRLFDIEEQISSSMATQRVWALANEHLPRGRAAEFNQALMDLGASLCKPRKPQCEVCPLSSECQSYALGNQLQRPVRAPKKAVPLRKFAAAVILQNGKTLILQRPPEGLLGGMWEFPNVPLIKSAQAKRGILSKLDNELDLTATVGEKLIALEHAYSHFRASLDVYLCSLSNTESVVNPSVEHRWVKVNELKAVPMGKLDRQIANRLLLDVG